MTTPAPDLTRRERAAIARLLHAADSLSEQAQRVLEDQLALRGREQVRWAGDAQRAGVASPVFPPAVYVRAGIPVEFAAPPRPGGPRRSVHRGIAGRICPGMSFVAVCDVTDGSRRIVALERLQPAIFPRPAHAIFLRYLRLEARGNFTRARRVWLEDELSTSSSWMRLPRHERAAAARLLREADELSLKAQRELTRAVASRLWKQWTR